MLKNNFLALVITLLMTTTVLAVTLQVDLTFGTQTNTETSGDAVVLFSTPEAQWAAGGVQVNQHNNTYVESMRLVGDGGTGAFVAWIDSYGPIESAWVAHLDAAGTVIDQYLTDGGRTNEAVDLALSLNNGVPDGAVLCWEDYEKVGTEGRNIYVGKVDANAGLLWTDVDVSGRPGDERRPKLISDNAGGAVIVFQGYQTGSGEIYANRINSSGGLTDWPGLVTVCPSRDAGSQFTNPERAKIARAVTDAGESRYYVAWRDFRHNYGGSNYDIYLQSVENNGSLHFNTPASRLYGVSVSATALPKYEFELIADPSYTNAPVPFVIFEQGVDKNNVDVYAQMIMPNGDYNWSSAGVNLSNSIANHVLPTGVIVSGSNYPTLLASWGKMIDAANADGYVQKLSIYGTAEFGAGGIDLGKPVGCDLASDGQGGAFVAAIGGNMASPYPYAQKLTASGSEEWSEAGIQLSQTNLAITETIMSVAATTEPLGAIFIWNTGTGGNIYAQKIEKKYDASGIWTSSKTENTDTNFSYWITADWTASAPGSTALTAEVRTAASSAALDSASYVALTNGGAIPNNGKWIQTRFYFASDANRYDSPVLSALTLNYSTEGDVTDPTVTWVGLTGSSVQLVSGDYVTSDPTIDIILNDDVMVSSARLTFDGSPLSYSTSSTTATSWEISCQPSVTDGTHVLTIEVEDLVYNSTSKAYVLKRTTQAQVEQGQIKALASGNDILVAYELTASALVKVEIRDITGKKVASQAYAANAAGGTVGYNEVAVDGRTLGKGVYIITVTPVGAKPSIAKFGLQ